MEENVAIAFLHTDPKNIIRDSRELFQCVIECRCSRFMHVPHVTD